MKNKKGHFYLIKMATTNLQKILLVSGLSIAIVLSIVLGIVFGVKNINSNKTHHNSGTLRMIGYYQETATSNNCEGIQMMTPDKIPAQYYTHLVYGFAPRIKTDTWELDDPKSDAERYNSFNKLKEDHKNLKTLLSIGGDLPSVSPMSKMTSNKEWRKHFIDSSINFVKKYNFDGIDIDWEYPTDVDRGGSLDDKTGFTNLMKDFRDAINSDNSNLLLTAALPGGSYWGKNYNVQETINYVDWFNIMAYNVLGSWKGEARCSSPLDSNTKTSNDSVRKSVDYFTQDLDKKKFNLGVSLWGISYKLKDITSYDIGAPVYTSAEQPATPGFCTKQPGYLSWFEISKILKDDNSVTHKSTFDKTEICKYFTYNNDQWVGYDDQDTFGEKLSFMKSQNLGGISVWGMDSDIPEEFTLTKFLNDNI